MVKKITRYYPIYCMYRVLSYLFFKCNAFLGIEVCGKKLIIFFAFLPFHLRHAAIFIAPHLLLRKSYKKYIKRILIVLNKRKISEMNHEDIFQTNETKLRYSYNAMHNVSY